MHSGVFPETATPGIWRFTAFLQDTGAVAEILYDVADQQAYKTTDATASRIKLEKPLHILYVGDSLTDFARGSNYVDKVNFWLNKHNPGKASFRNAGVGGDFITRVMDRLNGMQGARPAWRQNMYDGLFEPAPDIIFIFLGHNDTLLVKRDGEKTPQVPTDIQEDAYRKAIAFLREKTEAEIALVSATSSVYEICRQNMEKRVAEGGRYYLFGKPEALEDFNGVLKKLSGELNTAYIDVYGPTKKHPDKPSLFLPGDGVHLSEKGHSFIADRLLEYLHGR